MSACPQRITTWLSPAIFAHGSLGLLVAATFAASTNPSNAVLVMLALVLFPSVGSLVVQFITSRKIVHQPNGMEDLLAMDKCLRPPPHTFFFIFAPSVTLTFILLLRLLLGEDHFGGIASQLDYGPKDGLEGGERNVAFTPGFNTFGHTLQGVLAGLFAHPAISISTAWFLQMVRNTCSRSIANNPWWISHDVSPRLLSVTRLTASVFTAYPSYNMVKRLIKSPDTFASSSFPNNASEWALGFLFGWALGQLVTDVIKLWTTFKLLPLRQEESIEIQEQLQLTWILNDTKDENVDPRKGAERKCVTTTNMFFGLFLWFTIFGSSYLFGHTWNTCPSEDDDGEVIDATACVNYSSNEPLGLTVLFVFVAALGLMWAVLESQLDSGKITCRCC